MKPAAVILEALRARNLEDALSIPAAQHAVTVDEVLGDSKVTEVVAARHAFFVRLYWLFDQNLSVVARFLGVDHTTIRNALKDAQPEITRVLYDAFETDRAAYKLEWISGRSSPWRITDRVIGTAMHFPSLELAKSVFRECVEQARREPADEPAPQAAEGGAR